MRPKSERDFFAALLFIVIGMAFAMYASHEYDMGTAVRPGPAYFPYGLGFLLSGLGAVLLFKALTIETADREPVGRLAWRPLLVVVGAILVFALALPRLGLPVTTVLVVFGVSFASDEVHWQSALAAGVFLAAFCVAVFVWGLRLQIPVWPTSPTTWGF